MSDTLTKPEDAVDARTEDGGHDKFRHYVRKDKMLQAMVEGIPCTALCGKTWLPTTQSERYPVCPDCKALHELPIFKDD